MKGYVIIDHMKYTYSCWYDTEKKKYITGFKKLQGLRDSDNRFGQPYTFTVDLDINRDTSAAMKIAKAYENYKESLKNAS